jgi:hypothetical protein
MISHRGRFRLRGTATVLIALALFGVGVPWLAALAQDVAPPTAQPDPQPPAMQVPDGSYKPGFIDAMGRWLDEGRSKFDSQLKDAQDKILQLHNQTQDNVKDAAGALVRLPSTRLIDGRERCEVAPNGAPDCRMASAALCRGKGFQGGTPFGTQSEENCSARPLLSGRPPECRTETFVTRAVCQ